MAEHGQNRRRTAATTKSTRGASMPARPLQVRATAARKGAPSQKSEMTPAQRRRRAEMKRRRERRRKRQLVYRWLLAVVAALVVALLIRSYVFEIVRIQGPSMNDTLVGGDFVLITKFDYRLREPQSLDVVYCSFPNQAGSFVKRIVAGPGDTLAIQEGKTLVNGQEVLEPYVDHPAQSDYGPVMLGDDQYFVLGDNRARSNDSRSDEVGVLSRARIHGKVHRIVWPPNHARGL